jgi:phosphoribosylformylglycinamidine synthase
VTGGNVSFYNQSSYEGPVFPTPTIGMLGIVRDKKFVTTIGFKNEGDAIYLLGRSRNDINSSEYVYSICGIKNTPAPDFDLDEEFNLQQTLLSAIKAGLIVSAHDCADGGLFITLLESAMHKGLGFEISSDKNVRKDAFLFGEAQSRVVISIAPGKENDLKAMLEKSGLAFSKLGNVKGKNLVIDGENFGGVEEYKVSYDTTIEKLMN